MRSSRHGDGIAPSPPVKARPRRRSHPDLSPPRCRLAGAQSWPEWTDKLAVAVTPPPDPDWPEWTDLRFEQLGDHLEDWPDDSGEGD